MSDVRIHTVKVSYGNLCKSEMWEYILGLSGVGDFYGFSSQNITPQKRKINAGK